MYYSCCATVQYLNEQEVGYMDPWPALGSTYHKPQTDTRLVLSTILTVGLLKRGYGPQTIIFEQVVNSAGRRHTLLSDERYTHSKYLQYRLTPKVGSLNISPRGTAFIQ